MRVGCPTNTEKIARYVYVNGYIFQSIVERGIPIVFFHHHVEEILVDEIVFVFKVGSGFSRRAVEKVRDCIFKHGEFDVNITFPIASE